MKPHEKNLFGPISALSQGCFGVRPGLGCGFGFLSSSPTLGDAEHPALPERPLVYKRLQEALGAIFVTLLSFF